MIDIIIGKKLTQTQKFLMDGTRIPVTQIWVSDMPVVSVKTKDKHGYMAVQLGFGQKKGPNKPLQGHIRGANLKNAPQILREVRVLEEKLPGVGEMVKVADVLHPGNIVDVMGVSKGKGFAGVVKRHHFKGGPRTHGQSDRERAPGSIGQTTTPGRVYKGKRMAGRMGHETVTVKNLEVVGLENDQLLVKGLVPGGRNSILLIKKVGENKKFVPLYREESASNAVLTTSDGAEAEETNKVVSEDTGEQVQKQAQDEVQVAVKEEENAGK